MTEPSAPTAPIPEAELRAAVARLMPGVRADLERLVRIPSVAFPGFDLAEVHRSAELTAEILRGVGLPEVEILALPGGKPHVVARRPAPPGAPTVLLYAHHDVQPAGDLTAWVTPPFEPTERNGRLYARGAADDKAGVMAHVAALRAHGDRLPVGVTVFIEGAEEIGSERLGEFIDEHRDRLAADVIVIADSGNWDIGQPALTTALRGIVNAYVEVRVLDHNVHSGMFGGAVPDALTALCRLLATAHDAAGDVAIEGLASGPTPEVDYPADRVRAEAGMLDGVEFIGTGTLSERMWVKPAFTVLGIDAPGAAESANALLAFARAKVSVRIGPGNDARKTLAALTAHMERHAPWGVQVAVTLDHDGEPIVIHADGPAHQAAREAFQEAWDGVAPVDMGVGGSIPFIADFASRFPDAAILVTGVEDPDTRAHGPNEGLHLAEFERACLAEALLLAKLARR